MKNLVYFALGLSLTSQLLAENTIRVKIASSIPKIKITSSTPMDIVLHRQKKKRRSKKVTFNCQRNTDAVHHRVKFASLFGTSNLKFNNLPFPAKMEIHSYGKKGCDLINIMDIDDYIISLLAKEMNNQRPIEALKAQAVAARSYAFHKIKNSSKKALFHIESSERHQVSGSLRDESSRSATAASMTKGLILTNKKGKLKPTFYHSSCGGQLFTPHEVWQNKVEGYQRKRCPYCHGNTKNKWNNTIDQDKFQSAIKKIIKKDINLNDYSMTDYNGKIILTGKKTYQIRKADLRKKLGRKVLPSHTFKIRNKEGMISFQGRGNGHGVGMCQIGALNMANKGFSFREILAFYYPDLIITQRK